MQARSSASASRSSPSRIGHGCSAPASSMGLGLADAGLADVPIGPGATPRSVVWRHRRADARRVRRAVLFGLFKAGSPMQGIATIPEVIWEAYLAIWLTFKGFSSFYIRSRRDRLRPGRCSPSSRCGVSGGEHDVTYRLALWRRRQAAFSGLSCCSTATGVSNAPERLFATGYTQSGRKILTRPTLLIGKSIGSSTAARVLPSATLPSLQGTPGGAPGVSLPSDRRCISKAVRLEGCPYRKTALLSAS